VIGSINLPAGKHLISAKTYVESLPFDNYEHCTLVAGNSADVQYVQLKPSLGLIDAGIALSIAYSSAPYAQALYGVRAVGL